MPVGEVDLLGIGLLTMMSFVFTNLDNLILGVIAMSSRPEKPLPVQIGMVSAAALVLLVSLLALTIGRTIDAGLLGYLGMVPIGIGLYTLFKSKHKTGTENEQATQLKRDSGWGSWLATTTLLSANSGDSVAVILPLMAESNLSSASVIALTFIACAVGWAISAKLLTRHQIFAQKLQHYGERFVPWIMIGVGIYILLDTGTDSLI